MRQFKLALLTLLVSAPFLNHEAFAAAFQLYELGTPIIGTAGVGQAVTDDASSAYFNPAAMAFLPNSEFMLGTQFLLPYTHFSKNSNTTIFGNNGGTATVLTPGMGMFYSYNFAPCLKFGVSLTSPYAGYLNYDDGWAGRYIVQDAFFYTINLNPSFTYRFNQWFAFGAGAVLEYMNLQQTTALQLSPLTQLIDGQVNVKVSDFSPGFNFGLMFMPYESTRLGLAYRSQITHNLHGDLTFLRLAVQPNATTKMIMPQTVVASFAQDFAHQFTLLLEAGWANWSSTKNTILHVDGFTSEQVLNWNNTYRLGLGLKYKATQKLLLQTGVSYDSSPTKASERLPVLPMDRQVRAGLGLVYQVIKPVKLGFNYEYWNMGSARINNVSTNGVLSGSYSKNYANVFEASVNVEV